MGVYDENALLDLRRNEQTTWRCRHKVCPSYLKPRKGEEPEHYMFRCNDCGAWIAYGSRTQEHFMVENWAVKEFQKCRKRKRYYGCYERMEPKYVPRKRL
jgi:hypothetical protein